MTQDPRFDAGTTAARKHQERSWRRHWEEASWRAGFLHTCCACRRQAVGGGREGSRVSNQLVVQLLRRVSALGHGRRRREVAVCSLAPARPSSTLERSPPANIIASVCLLHKLQHPNPIARPPINLPRHYRAPLSHSLCSFDNLACFSFSIRHLRNLSCDRQHVRRARSRPEQAQGQLGAVRCPSSSLHLRAPANITQRPLRRNEARST